MMKRVAGILLGIGLSVSLLTGCGKSAASEAAKESTETEKAGNGEGEEATNKEADKNTDKDSAKADSEAGETEEPVITVGILLGDRGIRTDQIDGEELESGIQAKNYETELCYAQSDAEKQLTQFQELLDQGVEAFVIDPVDSYAFAEKLREVYENLETPIKVISYNNLIMNTNRVNYYVTFDEREAGHQMGEQIVKAFSLDKAAADTEPVTIEFVMGAPDRMEDLFYHNGILEILEPYLESGVLVCKSNQTAFAEVAIPEKNPEQARDRIENLLERYDEGEAPDILVTGFDAAVYEVQEVLEERGIACGGENWPWISGFGSEAEAVRDIAEGRIQCTVYLDHRTLAQKCVDMLVIYLGGESPDVDNYEQYDNGVKIISTNLCQGKLIDKDDYQMLVDNGYYKAEEVEALSPVTPAVTATPEPTATVRPTATPEPTAAARPTATPKPTATAKLTAAPKA